MDDADYASIVSQVKNAEFNSEIARRIEELNQRHEAEQELAKARTEQSYKSELNKKQLELSAKEAEIARIKTEASSQLVRIQGEKDAEIARLKNQLENIEEKRMANSTWPYRRKKRE